MHFHVFHRAAIDAEKLIKNEMEAVSDLLKAICYGGTMREEFANIQVRLGFQKKLDLPNLDEKKEMELRLTWSTAVTN